MLTSVCNNSCKYCFAHSQKEDDNKFITIDNFKFALEFITNSFDIVGIIGGEPTLHPEFYTILNLIIANKKIKKSVIYTNGYKINNYLDILNNDKFTILINCNSQEDIGYENYKIFQNNIMELKEKLPNEKYRLGFNLYKENQNFDFLIDLLQMTNQKDLRFSISVPSQGNVIEFNSLLKSTMIKLFKKLNEIGVTPHFDCNAFPNCLLNEDDKKLFNNIKIKSKERGCEIDLINNKKVCLPQIVIKPDLTAIRCFASGDYQNVNIKDFKNAAELFQYFYLNIDVFQNALYLKKECLTCSDRLINCNICSYYNIGKIDRLRQFSINAIERGNY
jgi:sulfatase maturation enzyme AslB (radical SAM superfamily)